MTLALLSVSGTGSVLHPGGCDDDGEEDDNDDDDDDEEEEEYYDYDDDGDDEDVDFGFTTVFCRGLYKRRPTKDPIEHLVQMAKRPQTLGFSQLSLSSSQDRTESDDGRMPPMRTSSVQPRLPPHKGKSKIHACPALPSSAGLFEATFLHIYTRDRHGENVPDALRVKDMQQAKLVDVY